MIGLGTYSFFWQHSDRAPEPLTLADMIARTRGLDGDVFQICDYEQVASQSDSELADLRACAEGLDVALELGTKGVRAAHLERYLSVASALGAPLVRSMVKTGPGEPDLANAEAEIRSVLPAYAAAGVTLALETYEEVRTADLVSLVESIGSDQLGICLDPANCVAALENPIEVIDRCAPYVANMHIKDFTFSRRDGLVGFTLEGAELGTGLLDYAHLMRAVGPEARGINRIVEHWIPWRGSFSESAAEEDRWNTANLTYMRSN